MTSYCSSQSSERQQPHQAAAYGSRSQPLTFLEWDGVPLPDRQMGQLADKQMTVALRSWPCRPGLSTQIVSCPTPLYWRSLFSSRDAWTQDESTRAFEASPPQYVPRDGDLVSEVWVILESPSPLALTPEGDPLAAFLTVIHQIWPSRLEFAHPKHGLFAWVWNPMQWFLKGNTVSSSHHCGPRTPHSPYRALPCVASVSRTTAHYSI